MRRSSAIGAISALAYACTVGTSHKVSARPRGVASTAGVALFCFARVDYMPVGTGLITRVDSTSDKAARLASVPRRVALEDLIDAHDLARILGLSHRNTVSLYMRRYPDMPRPVLDLGNGRPSLWLRPEIERWHARQRALGKTRSRRRSGR